MSGARVGIGLPVRNGERFLAAGLDSLLAQHFEDFTVVICDNASTDATEEIARDYAARDPRIRFHRNERDLGAAANFNHAFELCEGEFFKWVAHDDLHAPEFLSACVEVLDREPDVVLCHSLVRFIDPEARSLGDHEPRLTHQDDASLPARFRDLISMRHWCFDVFGLIRRDVLSQTPLIAPYVGSDRNLLVELGLHGRLHCVPKHLFLSRDHGDRSIRAMNHLRDRVAWFDPARKGEKVYPHWRHLREYHRSLSRVGVSFSDRIACDAALLAWMKRFRRELIDDLTYHPPEPEAKG